MKKIKSLMIIVMIGFALVLSNCTKEPTNPLGPSVSLADKVIYTLDQSENRIYVYDLKSDTILFGSYKIGGWGQDLQYDNGKLYGISTQDHNMKVIDVANNGLENFVDFGAGTSPEFIAYDDNYVYVTLNTDTSVAVVSKSSWSVEKKITVGKAPWGIYYYNGYLYVANTGYVSWGVYDTGTISVIDTANDSVVKTIEVGLNPQQITYNNGYIVVICAGNYNDISGEIDLIDPSTNTVTASKQVTGSATIVKSLSPGKVVFVTSSWPGPAAIYEATIPELGITKKLDLSVGGLIIGVNADKIYASSGYSNTGPGYIWQISVGTDYTVSDTVTVGTSPTALALQTGE